MQFSDADGGEEIFRGTDYRKNVIPSMRAVKSSAA